MLLLDALPLFSREVVLLLALLSLPVVSVALFGLDDLLLLLP